MGSSERVMAALCCALMACSPSAKPKPQELTSLASASSGDLRVEMLSGSPLVAGRNTVFYRVTNEGTAVGFAQLEQKPQHPCPLHDPSMANEAGLWEGTLIFPSAGQAGFGLDVRVKPEEARQRLDLGVLRLRRCSRTKVKTCSSRSRSPQSRTSGRTRSR